MHLRFVLSVTLLLSLLSVAAPALEFRVLSWQGEITGLHYGQRGATTAFAANDTGFSSPYLLAAGHPLELYRDAPEPEEKPVPVAIIKPPGSGVTHAILILAPLPAGGYTGHWIDDSLESHPVNTVRIYNLTLLSLALKSGDTRQPLVQGATSLLPFESTKRQLPLQVAAQTHGQWELLWASNIPVRKNYRVHILIKDQPPVGDIPDERIYPMLVHDYVPPARP